jgi:hypothetical protein
VEVLAVEGPGRGAPGDAPGGVGWAGGAVRVAVATWIVVGGGGGPLGTGGGTGAVVAAGCGWGN